MYTPSPVARIASTPDPAPIPTHSAVDISSVILSVVAAVVVVVFVLSKGKEVNIHRSLNKYNSQQDNNRDTGHANRETGTLKTPKRENETSTFQDIWC